MGSLIEARRRIIMNSPHIATSSGSIANFQTDLTSPLKSCKVNFLPVQEGTGDPSPTNVRTITGWDELNVYKCGENLFNYETAQINYGYIRNDSGAVQASSNWFYISTIYSVPDEGLLISLHPNFDAMRIYYLTDNDQWVGRSNVYSGTRLDVFKESGFSKIQLSFYNTSRDYIKSLSIEKNTATIRDSQKTVIPISWQSSLETIYGGQVDLVSGEVWKTHILMTDTWGNWGTLNTYDDGTEMRYKKFPSPVKGNGASNFNICLCNVARYTYANNNNTVHFYVVGNSYNCRIYLPSGTDTSLIIQALGELVTPELVTTITPQQLKTLKGTNNIWSNANGNIEIKYWTH